MAPPTPEAPATPRSRPTPQTRQTLYKYFEDGQRPNQDHFRALVDSTLNMYDEGFRKSDLHGVMIATPVGNYQGLISFYRGDGFARASAASDDPDEPLWGMRYGQAPLYGLEFSAGGETAPSVLSLHPAQRVGINTSQPQHALEVAGTVAASARIGTYPVPKRDAVCADGQWHALTDWLVGNWGFEVVASAGGPGLGRSAMLHAVALNACNPSPPRWFRFFWRRRRIRYEEAWYGQRCERLELEWQSQAEAFDDKDPEATKTWQNNARSYRLRIRSRCDYAIEKNRIEVRLTRLWPDDPPDDAVPAAQAPAAAAIVQGDPR